MSLKRKEPMRDYSDEETEHEKDDVSLDGSIDSAEDARRQNDRENGEDGTTKLKTSEPAAEELLRTKRQRFNKPFTEDLLVGYEGMQRIYSEFPLHCQAKVPRGGEMNYLNRLLTRYKEWAFQLHPGLAFPDVVAKCEALGSKARVRNVLIQMRHSERDRYIEDTYPEYAAKKESRAMRQLQREEEHRRRQQQRQQREQEQRTRETLEQHLRSAASASATHQQSLFDDEEWTEDMLPPEVLAMLDGNIVPPVITPDEQARVSEVPVATDRSEQQNETTESEAAEHTGSKSSTDVDAVENENGEDSASQNIATQPQNENETQAQIMDDEEKQF